MYNSMETTSATRRESVFLIHEDDSEDVAGEVERPEVDLVLKKHSHGVCSLVPDRPEV